MTKEKTTNNVEVPQEGVYALVYVASINIVQMATANDVYTFTGDGFVVSDGDDEAGEKVEHVRSIPPLFVRAVELVIESGWKPLGGVAAGNLAVNLEHGPFKMPGGANTPDISAPPIRTTDFVKFIAQAFTRARG